jgi:two-component system, NarL family, sensor histidine kinase UhpB
MLQEGLTNVARHANAKNVEVTLERVEPGREAGPDKSGGEESVHPWIELRVRDDGVGIAPTPLTSPKSLGLLGIRERARNLGGTASIGPAPEGGTLLTVRVPYAVHSPDPEGAG